MHFRISGDAPQIIRQKRCDQKSAWRSCIVPSCERRDATGDGCMDKQGISSCTVSAGSFEFSHWEILGLTDGMLFIRRMGICKPDIERPISAVYPSWDRTRVSNHRKVILGTGSTRYKVVLLVNGKMPIMIILHVRLRTTTIAKKHSIKSARSGLHLVYIVWGIFWWAMGDRDTISWQERNY